MAIQCFTAYVPYRRSAAVQARLDDRRRAVLDAAVDLLAERGYAGCSMAAVAERAGVGTGSVYQHFSGKSELALELYRTVTSREVAAVRDAAHGPGSVTTRLAAVVETFCRRARRKPRLAYALLVEPVDIAIDAERLVFRRAFRDVVAALIAEGVAEGTLPPQEPRRSAAAVIGAVAEALVGPSLGDEPSSGDLVNDLTLFVRRGVGAPPEHER